MLEQERDDLLRGGVVLGLELQFLETLILADQVGRRTFDYRKDFFQRRAIGRGLEILDQVELDLALAQTLQRAARVASAGIVVQNDSFHAFLARGF